MKELMDFYKKNIIAENPYTRTMSRKVKYVLIQKLFILCVRVGAISILGCIILMGINTIYYNHRLYMCFIIIVIFSILLKSFLERQFRTFKSRCLESDFNYDYSISTYEYLYQIHLNKLSIFLSERNLLNIDRIISYENHFDNIMNSKIIISKQKFKMTSFVMTVIATFSISKVVESKDFQNLIDFYNSQGYTFTNVVTIISLIMILFGGLKIVDMYMNYTQDESISTLKTKLNSHEMEVQKMLIDIRWNLERCKLSNITSNQGRLK